MSTVKSHSSANVFSRSVVAIVGGYVLSNLLATFLSYLLPMPTADSVLLSLQLSFLFYAMIIIWAFSVKNVMQVWVGLVIACVFSAVGVYLTMPEYSL